MEAKLKLLEERVSETVEKLRALVVERERLRRELESERERARQVEHEAVKRGDDSAMGGWPVSPETVALELRGALRDLEDGNET